MQLEVGPELTARLVRRARAGGARITLNFSPPGMIGAETLRLVDLLIDNAQEFSWLAEYLGCGSSPASFHAALGVSAVMLGVQGVAAVFDGGYLKMDAFQGMRDITAPADAFTGILVGSLDRGDTLPTALHRATSAAALAVKQVGTGRSVPER